VTESPSDQGKQEKQKVTADSSPSCTKRGGAPIPTQSKIRTLRRDRGIEKLPVMSANAWIGYQRNFY
jgi:hypothetical protein